MDRVFELQDRRHGNGAKHVERSVQFFRCADCVGASAGMAALNAKPDENDPDAARASARLAAASAGIRARFEAPRMGAAIAWIRSRLAAGDPIAIYVGLAIAYNAHGVNEPELSPLASAADSPCRQVCRPPKSGYEP